MKHRGIGFAGVALGVSALALSIVGPMASAAKNSPPPTLTASCSGGDLSMTYSWSGFPGSTHFVVFSYAGATTNDVVKGGSGQLTQAENGLPSPSNLGQLSAELQTLKGAVIAGSQAVTTNDVQC